MEVLGEPFFIQKVMYLYTNRYCALKYLQMYAHITDAEMKYRLEEILVSYSLELKHL